LKEKLKINARGSAAAMARGGGIGYT